MGSPPFRDRALLTWASDLLTAVAGEAGEAVAA